MLTSLLLVSKVMSPERRLLACDCVRRGEENLNVSQRIRLGFFHLAFLVSAQNSLAQVTLLLERVV